jgi:putative protease
MAKFFNGKKVELLAPAGTMEIFRDLVKANCDAVFFGGKSLNMRMIRKGYNFSDDDIKEAVKMAHDVDKKVYITVNNMLNDFELDEAVSHLHYLNDIRVDGIIFADPAIMQICKEHHLNQFELHSSIMMNVHNTEFVKALKEYGVTRVVLSREMDLQTAKQLQRETGIETEYFVHGDMCTVNGGNCYYSSVVLGNSSNRGRCFKPCRWAYEVKKDGSAYSTQYPLAAKDMYMYEHIPELIEANVTSFKIEGRMREKEFIVNLVNTYGEAIDRYIEDPLSFNRRKNTEELHENRKRDFSTAYAFGKPGLSFINSRYEGTGKFFSTGKMFSTPTEEPSFNEETLAKVVDEFKSYPEKTPSIQPLSVTVNSYEQAKACIELGVERIYLPVEVYAPNTFMTAEQLEDLVRNKKQTDLYLHLPQMMNEQQFEMIDHYLERNGHLFDGLLATNIGAINRYADKYPVVSDFSVNVYNHKALEFLRGLGVKESTLSIECKQNELPKLLSMAETPVELIVHGPLKMMYLDLNLYDNTDAFTVSGSEDNQYVSNDILVLKHEKGENPVYIDQFQKNHLFSAKEFCLLPILDQLDFNKPISFRIEGQTYTTDELKTIIKVYQAAIKDKSTCKELFSKLPSVRAGYTMGSLSFKYTEKGSAVPV